MLMRWYCSDQIQHYVVYVKREIQNQSSLRHPLIVSLREVSPCQVEALLLKMGCGKIGSACVLTKESITRMSWLDNLIAPRHAHEYGVQRHARA